MSRSSQAGLWTLALGGSLALHGAVALALVALPAPQAETRAPTQISIESLAAGSVETLTAAPAVAAAAVDGAAPIAPSVVAPLAPADATEQVPVSADAAVPVAASPAESVEQAQDPAPQALPVADETAANPVNEVIAAPAAPTIDSAAAVEDEAAVAAAVETELELPSTAEETLAPAAATETAVAAPVDEPLSLTAADSALVPAQAAQDTQEAPLALSAPTLPTLSETTEIASALEGAPAPALAPLVEAVDAPTLQATDERQEAPLALPAPTLPTVSESTQIASVVQAEPAPALASSTEAAATQAVPAQVSSSTAAIAPSISSPAATVVATAPASSVASVAPTAAATAVDDSAPALAGIAASDATVQPIAPVEEDIGDPDASASRVETEEQVAIVVPDDVAVEPNAAPAHRDMPLADFLKSYEGEECILAIPTEANAVEALSDTNASVSSLSEAYQRMTGVPVTVQHSMVTAAQCATLSFSRSIAQYPDYPLRLDLDRREIASGSALSGRVSGLRKNTLYLFVVDDEGKAKLISQVSGVTRLSIDFSEPLTLTAGPVAAAQLLIAIASDGPLRTVPTRPGVVAEEFFASLAGEIRDDGRPILYGITSFIVR